MCPILNERQSILVWSHSWQQTLPVPRPYSLSGHPYTLKAVSCKHLRLSPEWFLVCMFCLWLWKGFLQSLKTSQKYQRVIIPGGKIQPPMAMCLQGSSAALSSLVWWLSWSTLFLRVPHGYKLHLPTVVPYLILLIFWLPPLPYYHFLTYLLVFPGIISQINHWYLTLSGLMLWGAHRMATVSLWERPTSNLSWFG